MSSLFKTCVCVAGALLAFTIQDTVLNAAVIYAGNGNTSFGGAVGGGSLSLNDDGTTVSGTFTRGGGEFNDALVIYIDSVSGGFTTTSGFTDSGDGLRRAISGVDGGVNRSTAAFASGFTANYAIALGAHGPNFGGIWGLAEGGSHSFISSVSLNPNNSVNSASYTFNFTWSQIGLTPNMAGNAFTFQSRYISDTGYGSLETFEDLSGSLGYSTVTFSTLDTYITTVPEPTHVALGIFGGARRLLAEFPQPSRALLRTRPLRPPHCTEQSVFHRG